jgi:hypothetical protein
VPDPQSVVGFGELAAINGVMGGKADRLPRPPGSDTRQRAVSLSRRISI